MRDNQNPKSILLEPKIFFRAETRRRRESKSFNLGLEPEDLVFLSGSAPLRETPFDFGFLVP
jgi:hypothetical protein